MVPVIIPSGAVVVQSKSLVITVLTVIGGNGAIVNDSLYVHPSASLTWKVYVSGLIPEKIFEV